MSTALARHTAAPTAPPTTRAPVPRSDDDNATPLWRKALPLVIILLVMALAGYGLSTMMKEGGSGPKKQMVKIAVLPDTPPPPPPPPKEEKKPELEEAPKQVMPTEQQKADTPPPPGEPLKMEGAAGDGPSAFGQGSVGKEYNGQQISTGGGAPQPKAADRAKFKYYANSARQVLRTELDKTLPPELLSLGARLLIWVDDAGAISRFELNGVSDKAAEDKLRQAMDAASRGYRLTPPAGMPQPLELRLSVNPVNG
jgi:protein TonB